MLLVCSLVGFAFCVEKFFASESKRMILFFSRKVSSQFALASVSRAEKNFLLLVSLQRTDNTRSSLVALCFFFFCRRLN